jgi:hypothetical protein
MCGCQRGRKIETSCLMDTVSIFFGYEPSSVVEFWPSMHKPCMWLQPVKKKLFKKRVVETCSGDGCIL